MPTFSTSFAPPDPVTGLSAFGDITTSTVVLTWDATSLGVDFVEYRVYRSLDGVTYEQIASIVVEADSEFDDVEAPSGIPLWYRVTVVNPDFESAPAEVTSELGVTQWWLVTPGDPSATFSLDVATGYNDAPPLQQDDYIGLGRSRKIVVTGELLGVEGTLTVNLSRADASIIERLRAASVNDATSYVLLKSPFGEVFRVLLRTISRMRGTAGRQVVTIPYVEVA